MQQFPVRALGSLTVEGLQSEVKIRVGEYQSPNRGSDPIPCSDAHGTPGRISTENDARGPCLAPNAALEIVDCIEERVLGREAVVHGNDSAAQDCCETTTVGVLEVEITEHPVSAGGGVGDGIGHLLVRGVGPRRDAAHVLIADHAVK